VDPSGIYKSLRELKIHIFKEIITMQFKEFIPYVLLLGIIMRS
jgi:hypothetical protein